MTEKSHAYVNSTTKTGGMVYAVNRRSVYLPVIRSGLYDVFQAFDFADPSASNGKRIPTTVAPQALFMMNDQVVLKGSAAMARRLLASARSRRRRTDSSGIPHGLRTAPDRKGDRPRQQIISAGSPRSSSRKGSAPRRVPCGPGKRSARRSSPPASSSISTNRQGDRII